MGVFSDFLSSKGLSEEQILRRSQRLERLTSKDRDLQRQRESKRRNDPRTSYEAAGIAKPRSGRRLRPEHVQAAMQDVPLPGPVRTKMLRTVNSLLQGKGPVDMPTLFGKVPGKQGKKPR